MSIDGVIWIIAIAGYVAVGVGVARETREGERMTRGSLLGAFVYFLLATVFLRLFVLIPEKVLAPRGDVGLLPRPIDDPAAASALFPLEEPLVINVRVALILALLVHLFFCFRPFARALAQRARTVGLPREALYPVGVPGAALLLFLGLMIAPARKDANTTI